LTEFNQINPSDQFLHTIGKLIKGNTTE